MNFDVLVIKTEKNKEFWPTTFASLENHPIRICEIDGNNQSMFNNIHRWPDICTSKYISFVCDDDLVADGAFEKCARFLEEKPHVKAMYTNSWWVDSVKNTDRLLYNTNHKWDIEWQLQGTVPVHHLVVVERELVGYAIDRVRRLPEYEEMVMWYPNEVILFCIIATQTPWYFYPEVLYTWRRHALSESNRPKGNEERAMIVKVRKLQREIFRDERIY